MREDLAVEDGSFSLSVFGHVIAALTKAGFTGVRVERPHAATAWNVMVAAR